MAYADQYIDKLRKSGLRPTKQRIKICEVLFDTDKTFHFTIKELVKIIENQANIKVSLATVYNTVHAFIKKGYLKEIPLNSSQSYYDTNVSHHHHFFDEEENKLIDIDQDDVDEINIRKKIPGKKIRSVEVIAKIVTDNQSQK
jgi:Fur family iron response transcriptional regulator